MKISNLLKFSLFGLAGIFVSAASLYAQVDTYRITRSDGFTTWSALGAWKIKDGTDYVAATQIPPSGSAIEYYGVNKQGFVFDLDTTSGEYLDYSIASFKLTNDTNAIMTFSSKIRITGDLSGSNGGNRGFRIRGTGEILIEGNVVYTGSGSNSQNNYFSFGDSDVTVSKVEVDGNATITYADFRFAATNYAKIKGLVDMQNKADGLIARSVMINSKSSGTSNVEFGALQGARGTNTVGGLYVNGAGGGTGNLTFTGIGSGTYTYYGDVKNNRDSGGSAALNIIMNAGNGNFTQVFAGEIGYSGATVLTKGNLKFNALNNITLGNLYLGYETVRNSTGEIVNFTAVENAQTSITFSGVNGTIEEFYWSSGKLGFELSDAALTNAVINVIFGVYLDYDAESFTFDFRNAERDQKYALIYSESGGFDASALEKFIAMENGKVVNGTFEIEDDLNGGQTLYFTIPEPSTYAAIFGAIALIGVLLRRRK